MCHFSATRTHSWACDDSMHVSVCLYPPEHTYVYTHVYKHLYVRRAAPQSHTAAAGYVAQPSPTGQTADQAPRASTGSHGSTTLLSVHTIGGTAAMLGGHTAASRATWRARARQGGILCATRAAMQPRRPRALRMLSTSPAQQDTGGRHQYPTTAETWATTDPARIARSAALRRSQAKGAARSPRAAHAGAPFPRVVLVKQPTHNPRARGRQRLREGRAGRCQSTVTAPLDTASLQRTRGRGKGHGSDPPPWAAQPIRQSAAQQLALAQCGQQELRRL